MARVTEEEISVGERLQNAGQFIRQGVQDARDYKKDMAALEQQRQAIALKKQEMQQAAEEAIWQKKKFNTTTSIDMMVKGYETKNDDLIKRAYSMNPDLNPEEIKIAYAMEPDLITGMNNKYDMMKKEADAYAKAGNLQKAIEVSQEAESFLAKQNFKTAGGRKLVEQLQPLAADTTKRYSDIYSQILKNQGQRGQGAEAAEIALGKSFYDEQGKAMSEAQTSRAKGTSEFMQSLDDTKNVFSIINDRNVKFGQIAGTGIGLTVQELFGDNATKEQVQFFRRYANKAFINKILTVAETAGAKAADTEGEKKILKLAIMTGAMSPDVIKAVAAVDAANSARQLKTEEMFQEYKRSGKPLSNWQDPILVAYVNDAGDVVALPKGEKAPDGYITTTEYTSNVINQLEAIPEDKRKPLVDTNTIVNKYNF